MAFKEDYWKNKMERQERSYMRTALRFLGFAGRMQAMYSAEPEKVEKTAHTRSRKERLKRNRAHAQRMYQANHR